MCSSDLPPRAALRAAAGQLGFDPSLDVPKRPTLADYRVLIGASRDRHRSQTFQIHIRLLQTSTDSRLLSPSYRCHKSVFVRCRACGGIAPKHSSGRKIVPGLRGGWVASKAHVGEHVFQALRAQCGVPNIRSVVHATACSQIGRAHV